MSAGGGGARGERAFRRLTAALGLLGAFCLAPPGFSRLFALHAWFEGETVVLLPELSALWGAAALLAGLSLALLSTRLPAAVALVAFSALLLLFAELGTRLAARIAGGTPYQRLADMEVATYPQFARMLPHPFFQFVKPSGYHRRDPVFAGPPAPPLARPAGTVRVVTLGGSTTDNAWPGIMQEELAALAPGSERWEVRNLATLSYTSAHSLVKFALVGLDLAPDYVVIHHGWNDTYAWGFGEAFRGDYWHALGPWTPPGVPLRWLVRASVAYRWLAYGTQQPAPWEVLNAWRPEGDRLRARSPDATPAERATFARNVRSIAILAGEAGAVVVLATLPISPKRAAEFPDEAARLRTTNDVLRALAAASEGEIVLADLARELSEPLRDHFLDLAHTDAEGHRAKGRTMARLLAADRAARLVRSSGAPGPSARPPARARSGSR